MEAGFKLLPTGSANLPSAKRITRYSKEELVFKREAAAEYDRAFSHVTRYFMPFVLRTARVAPGMRVLDIAAGTGISAEAALSALSARPALRRARSAVCSGGDLSIFSEFFHPAFRTSSRLLSDYCCLDSLAVKKQA